MHVIVSQLRGSMLMMSVTGLSGLDSIFFRPPSYSWNMTLYLKVSMMTNMTQYGVHILILLVESLLLVSPGLVCPEISYLGGPAQLFCTGGALVHIYYNTGGKVAACGLTAKSSCTSSNMSAYRLSSNQTGLNITRAQKSDAGKWTCSYERNSNTSCNLTIANIPTYNITSDRATDAMDVHDGVSLTVDIRGFYCSAAHNLILQVGSVTLPLNMYLPEAVTEPTNRNFTIPINVTDSHFGNIELIFLCNGQQLNVSHRSVTQLQQITSTTVSGSPTTEIPPKDVSTLLIVAAGVTSAVIIILIITIACCCCCCRKKVIIAATRQSNLPSESNMAYYEAGVSFQDVNKSNGINGTSKSCATQCSVVTLRDTEDPHDSMGNRGSIYDRLYLN